MKRVQFYYLYWPTRRPKPVTSGSFFFESKISFAFRAASRIFFSLSICVVGLFCCTFELSSVPLKMIDYFWPPEEIEVRKSMIFDPVKYLKEVAVLIHCIPPRNLWSHDWIASLIHLCCKHSTIWPQVQLNQVIVNFIEKISGSKLQPFIKAFTCMISFEYLTGSKSIPSRNMGDFKFKFMSAIVSLFWNSLNVGWLNSLNWALTWFKINPLCQFESTIN